MVWGNGQNNEFLSFINGKRDCFSSILLCSLLFLIFSASFSFLSYSPMVPLFFFFYFMFWSLSPLFFSSLFSLFVFLSSFLFFSSPFFISRLLIPFFLYSLCFFLFFSSPSYRLVIRVVGEGATLPLSSHCERVRWVGGSLCSHSQGLSSLPISSWW